MGFLQVSKVSFCKFLNHHFPSLLFVFCFKFQCLSIESHKLIACERSLMSCVVDVNGSIGYAVYVFVESPHRTHLFYCLYVLCWKNKVTALLDLIFGAL